MKGYLNNPEATSDMIDDEGWLHSGDIGYADADGYLFVVDRVKELIKYKGMQVAPAELEGVIQAHQAVADVAVIPVPDLEAGEIPKAFVVLKPDAQATGEEIMAHVAERVAPHKKVRLVEFIDAIPKVPVMDRPAAVMSPPGWVTPRYSGKRYARSSPAWPPPLTAVTMYCRPSCM